MDPKTKKTTIYGVLSSGRFPNGKEHPSDAAIAGSLGPKKAWLEKQFADLGCETE